MKAWEHTKTCEYKVYFWNSGLSRTPIHPNPHELVIPTHVNWADWSVVKQGIMVVLYHVYFIMALYVFFTKLNSSYVSYYL